MIHTTHIYTQKKILKKIKFYNIFHPPPPPTHRLHPPSFFLLLLSPPHSSSFPPLPSHPQIEASSCHNFLVAIWRPEASIWSRLDGGGREGQVVGGRGKGRGKSGGEGGGGGGGGWVGIVAVVVVGDSSNF